MYKERLAQLYRALETAGLDGLALNPGPSLVYLTGLHFGLMERPVVALFKPSAPPAIILPELEAGKVAQASYEIRPFPYGENPSAWQGVYSRAAASMGLDGLKIGVEPTRLRVLELRLLEAALPGARFLSGQMALASLRMCKDRAEIDRMRRAVQIAQQGFLAMLPSVKAGVTEREVASELTLQLLRAGSTTELPFAPIIASGPNGANPHAVPTDRRLEPGDAVVVDWGAGWEDYTSDLTRTLSVGEPGAELAKVARIVIDSNAAGRHIARPGLPVGQVDQAAREVIERAGFGPQFFHRTGHGLGMEDHEEPYVFGENQLPLAPGMTFTVEPGIYLVGKFGVRIEDDVVVTETGAESLSDLPHDLYIVG